MTLSHLVLYVFSYIQQLFSSTIFIPHAFMRNLSQLYFYFLHIFIKLFLNTTFILFYFVIFSYLTSLMVFMKCNILFGVIHGIHEWTMIHNIYVQNHKIHNTCIMDASRQFDSRAHSDCERVKM